MTHSAYTIRNYRPTDFEGYLQLHIEAEKLEPTRRYPPPQTLRERLDRPNYSPEQDLFIVRTGENIVGYMDVSAELDIGRVILNCLIHPEHRRRGLASKLLEHATHRAEEVGAKVVQVNVLENNPAAKSTLPKLGFSFVRRFLRMSLDMTGINEPEMSKAALLCRPLQHGEEDRLTEIQNRSFAGGWGYNPNTVEQITRRINLHHGCPEDVVLACDGDKITGYCWTRVIDDAGPAGSERKGQIFMLGVDPDCHGRGIGKVALLAGLSYLKDKGLKLAELEVDSKNKVAYALYQSIGFKVQTSSLWYEKAVV